MHTAIEEISSRKPPRGQRLLSYEELRQLGIPYSKVQLWRMAKEGTFPAPVKLGHSRRAWVEEEVNEWMVKLIQNRTVEVSDA